MKPKRRLVVTFPSGKKVEFSTQDPPEQIARVLADAAGPDDNPDRRWLKELMAALGERLRGLQRRLHRRLRRRLADPGSSRAGEEQ